MIDMLVHVSRRRREIVATVERASLVANSATTQEVDCFLPLTLHPLIDAQ